MPIRLLIFLFTVCFLTNQALGRAKKVKPHHDPVGQLFRHAPMAKATRSVVIPLGKLQYAFDSENLRAHTVWLGKLDLYGPQYAHSKRPFIAQVNGDILMENPPTLPWRLTDPTVEFQLNPTSITGQFKGTSLRGNTASLHYQLTLPDHAPVDITIQPSASDHGFRRAITVSPVSYTHLTLPTICCV